MKRELLPVKRERTGAIGETAVSSWELKASGDTRQEGPISEVRRELSCSCRRRATSPTELSGSQSNGPPLPPIMLIAEILIPSGGLSRLGGREKERERERESGKGERAVTI